MRSVLDIDHGPVLVPEHVVVDANPVCGPKRAQDRTCGGGIRRTVGPRMMEQIMNWLAHELGRGVPKQLGSSAVDQRAASMWVKASQPVVTGVPHHPKVGPRGP